MDLGSGGDVSALAMRMMVFSVAIMILLPTMLTVVAASEEEAETSELTASLLEDYYNFTGQDTTSETVWALTGIYTPYYYGAYGYTDDGWLYGSRIVTYSPSQYEGKDGEYTVVRDLSSGLYYYDADYEYGDYSEGDLYTSVTFDVSQMSSLFFTSNSKTSTDDGFFYYDYTGYRYAFQPVTDSYTTDEDGNTIYVSSSTTSLSLIWYDYYDSTGISGQLVLTGSDGGLAYITGAQIVSAFDSTTSTAKFIMTFNGVDLNIYIRIDPSMIAEGYSVQDCYSYGYWSIMVTSTSVDASSYVSADYSFNVSEIWNTFISLFTFSSEDLGLDGIAGTVCSLLVTVPLYISLICIGMAWYPVLILTLVLAAVQTVAAWFG